MFRKAILGINVIFFGGYILLYYLPHLTLSLYVDLARAKSKALNDIYSLLKLNII